MTTNDDSGCGFDDRKAELRKGGFAVGVRHDNPRSRIVVEMSTGVEFSFPTEMAQGLAGADPCDLDAIEIRSAGLCLHWPRLDASLDVPALLQGSFGTAKWMAVIECARDDFAEQLIARKGTIDRSIDLEF